MFHSPSRHDRRLAGLFRPLLALLLVSVAGARTGQAQNEFVELLEIDGEEVPGSLSEGGYRSQEPDLLLALVRGYQEGAYERAEVEGTIGRSLFRVLRKMDVDALEAALTATRPPAVGVPAPSRLDALVGLLMQQRRVQTDSVPTRVRFSPLEPGSPQTRVLRVATLGDGPVEAIVEGEAAFRIVRMTVLEGRVLDGPAGPISVVAAETTAPPFRLSAIAGQEVEVEVEALVDPADVPLKAVGQPWKATLKLVGSNASAAAPWTHEEKLKGFVAKAAGQIHVRMFADGAARNIDVAKPYPPSKFIYMVPLLVEVPDDAVHVTFRGKDLPPGVSITPVSASYPAASFGHRVDMVVEIEEGSPVWKTQGAATFAYRIEAASESQSAASLRRKDSIDLSFTVYNRTRAFSYWDLNAAGILVHAGVRIYSNGTWFFTVYGDPPDVPGNYCIEFQGRLGPHQRNLGYRSNELPSFGYAYSPPKFSVTPSEAETLPFRLLIRAATWISLFGGCNVPPWP